MVYLPDLAYRAKPVVCLAVSVLGMSSGHIVGIIAGVVLALCGAWILNCRLAASRRPCRFCINNVHNNRYGQCDGQGACHTKKVIIS